MSISAKQSLLLGKIEATPGVDAAPTTVADAIRVIGRPKLTVNAPLMESDALKTTFGKPVAGIVDEQSLQLEVEFYIRSGGVLGAMPDWGPIAHAASHTVTANAGTNVTINPITALGASRHTSTFYWYDDGVLWKLVGAVCSAFAVSAPIDGLATGKATIIAPFAAPVAAALPAGIAYQTSNPIKPKPADVITDAGAAIKVGSFEFDTGIQAAVRNLIGGSDANVTDRPRSKVTFSKDSLGTVADYDRLRQATSGAFQAQFGQAGNRVTISAPKAYYASVGAEAQDNLMMRNIELWLDEVNGDDAYSIVID